MASQEQGVDLVEMKIRTILESAPGWHPTRLAPMIARALRDANLLSPEGLTREEAIALVHAIDIANPYWSNRYAGLGLRAKLLFSASAQKGTE